MSDKPLVLSLLIGLIFVLVIAGVSLLVTKNALHDAFRQEVAKNISSAQKIEDLKQEVVQREQTIENITAEMAATEKENNNLKGAIANLSSQLDDMKLEKQKTEKLKEKLEDNLKEELMKKKPADS